MPCLSVAFLSFLAFSVGVASMGSCRHAGEAMDGPLTLCASPFNPAQPLSVSLYATPATAGLEFSLTGVSVLSTTEDPAGVYTASIASPASSVWPWEGFTVAGSLSEPGGVGLGRVVVVLNATHLVPGKVFGDGSAVPALPAVGPGPFEAHVACVGDITGNSHLDAIFVSNRVTYFVNNGGGGFTSTDGPSSPYSSCTTFDANGDGISDVVLTSASGVDLALGAAGVPSMLTAMAPTWPTLSTATYAAVGGWFFGTTRGVALATAATNVLLLDNGSGEYDAAVGDAAFPTGFGTTSSLAAADINGDSYLDVLEGNAAGVNNRVVLGGPSSWTASFVGGFDTLDATYALAVFDFNNDGVLDVLGATSSGVVAYLTTSTSPLAFSAATVFTPLPSASSYQMATFDAQPDGFVDVVVQGASTDGILLLHTHPLALHNATAAFQAGLGATLAAGDFDGDGDVDLLTPALRAGGAGDSGSTSAVVTLRVVAGDGSLSAHGATVSATCVAACGGTSWHGVHVVSGRGTAAPYDVHVSFPDLHATYNMTVVWPVTAWVPATPATHPRLGSLTPAATPSDARFITISPVRFSLTALPPQPWPFHTDSVPTVSSDSVDITIFAASSLDATANVAGLSVASATVNGVAVAPTASSTGYVFTYVTQAGDHLWPWEGLQVAVTMVDGAGQSASLSTVVHPGTAFELVSSPLGARQSTAIGDFDKDGFMDAVTDAGFYLNNGNGTFTHTPETLGVVALCDADGDGYLDVLSSDDSGLHLHTSLHNGSFSGAVTTAAGSGAAHVATGDLSGDGLPDAVITRSTTQTVLINTGSGFTDSTDDWRPAAAVAGLPGDAAMSTLVDIDADGDLDWFIVLKDASLRLLLSGVADTPTRTRLEDVGLDRGLTLAPTGTTSAVFADLDADGDLDIWTTQAGTGYVVYENTGFATFTPLTSFAPPSFSGLSAATVSLDVNFDGLPDVMTAPGLATEDVLLLTTPSRGFEPAGDWFGLVAVDGNTVVFDVDGDGDGDILSGTSLYKSSMAQLPQNNAHVVVRVLSAADAPDVVGARVAVTCVSCATPWQSVQSVGAAFAARSLGSTDVTLGFPDVHQQYNITVTWPYGAHTQATWATHRLLGMLEPWEFPPSGRVLVVRPTVATCTAFAPQWGGSLPPTTSDNAVITLTTSPPTEALAAFRATVSGVDVAASLKYLGNGEYEVTYPTPADDTQWPWMGLFVDVVLEDTAGLPVRVSERIFPGTSFVKQLSMFPGVTTWKFARLFIDVDRDGVLDVVWHFDNAVKLLLGNGAGSFGVDVASQWGLGTDVVSRAVGQVTAADFDNSGTLDLYVSGSPPQVFLNNGTYFHAVDLPIATGDRLAVADMDGNGWLDIVVDTGVLLNMGGMQFVMDSGSWGVDTSGRTVHALDLDGDGDVDLVRSYRPTVLNTLAQSGPGFTTIDLTKVAGSFDGVTAVDWNNDGFLDLYHNNFNVPHYMYLYDPATQRYAVPDAWVALNLGAGRGCTLVDANLDGRMDLIVDHGSTTVFANLGGSRWLRILDEAADEQGTVAVDVDGDGDHDLVPAANGAPVWESQAANMAVGNRFVVVRVLTEHGAPSAFGATVRAICVLDCGPGDVWQQVIPVHSSHNNGAESQYDVVLSFPDPYAAYNVTVRWPNLRHPDATGGSHPRLGRVVPWDVPPSDRLLIVAPSPPALLLTADPWDFGGVGGAPTHGDESVVTLRTSPLTTGLLAVRVTTNGHDGAASFTEVSFGVYEFRHLTTTDTAWPWAGLDVAVTVVDTAGVVAEASARLQPGAGFSAPTPSGLVAPVGCADLNDDGATDVYQASQVFVNDGSGSFTVNSDWVDSTTQWSVAGDFDNTGTVDYYYTWEGNPNQVMLVSGDTGSRNGRASLGCDGQLAAGDFNADGWLDVMCAAGFMKNNVGVQNNPDTSGVWAFHMESATQPLSVVDIDGDGDLDILRGNASIALNGLAQGAPGFTNLSVVTPQPNSDFTLAALDANSDGHLDIYAAHSGAPHEVYLYDPDAGAFAAEPVVASAVSGTSGLFTAVVDIGLDGTQDVLSGSSPTALVQGVASALWASSSFASDVASMCDVDGDGDVDAVLASGLVLMNHDGDLPTNNNMVAVRVLTEHGAASAIGALVRAVCVSGCSTPWQTVIPVGARLPTGVDAEYTVAVGFPDLHASYNLSVQWPNGRHPDATWASHSRLGGLVPWEVPQTHRLMQVLPFPTHLIVRLAEWDFDTARRAPNVGETHIITLTTWPLVSNLTLLTATTNGRDVVDTFTVHRKGEYSLTLTTEAGEEMWPWLGIDVDIVAVDSAGAVSTFSRRVASRTAFAPRVAAGPPASFLFAVADFNGDGLADVLSHADGVDMSLWLSTGVGTFTDASEAWGVTALGPNVQGSHTYQPDVMVGDFDNSGTIDLYLGGNVSRLVLNTGTSFVLHSDAVTPCDGPGVVGDFDANGWLDVLCRQVVITNSGGDMADATDDWAVSGLDGNRYSSVVDVDGDGDLDVWVGADGLLVNQIAQGSPSFLSRAISVPRYYEGNGGTPVDWNNDGFLDFYVNARNVHQMRFWDPATGSFVEAADWDAVIPDGTHDGLGTSASFMDADVNGLMDIRFDSDDAYKWLMYNIGGNQWENAADTTSRLHTAVPLDFDGDGDEDLFSVAGEVVENFAADMPAGNRFVVVRVLTAHGAPSAMGAQVHAACVAGCGPWAAWRSVVPVGVTVMRSNDRAYDAVVGFPDAFATYNVSVSWPNREHPDATWDTHTRLGGIVPWDVLPADRLMVVVPSTPVTVAAVEAWDYPGVGGPPTVGTLTTVTLTTTPRTPLLALSFAEVDGWDVSLSFVEVGLGVYTVEFETVEDVWPWVGVRVRLSMADTAGLLSEVDAVVVPRTRFSVVATVVGATPHHGVLDFNGDGLSDVYEFDGDGFALWRNTGSGFSSTLLGSDITRADAVAAGDLNGDPFLDLLLIGNPSGEIAYGSSATVDVVPVSTPPFSACSPALGDVNGDGVLDILCGFVYLSVASGYAADEAWALTVGPGRPTIVDIDGDGDLDVVRSGASIAVNRLAQGGDGFDVVSLGLPPSPPHVAVLDWDSDGVLDVLVCGASHPATLYVLNATRGEYAPAPGWVPPTAGAASDGGCIATDLDLNGRPDVVLGVNGTQERLLWNVGGGVGWQLAAVPGVTEGAQVGDVVFDVDGDGDEDVLHRLGGVAENHGGDLPSGNTFVVVRVLRQGGAPSAFGALVRGVCVAGCGEEVWQTVIPVGAHGGARGYDVPVGFPDPHATYNLSVSWPNLRHPSATYATHRRLGGIVPWEVPPGDRLMVVTPVAAVATVGVVAPFDNGADTAPGVGAPVTIPVSVEPNTLDLRTYSATVNGVGGLPVTRCGEEYCVEYATGVGDDTWPWRGLHVDVVLETSAGLPTPAVAHVVPGIVLESSPLPAALSDMTRGAAVGDITGDGAADVVVPEPSRLRVLVSEGGGTWSHGTEAWSPAGGVSAARLGDFTNDGLLDVLATDDGGQAVVFVNNGSSLSAGATVLAMGDVSGAAVGDVDGNGWLDVVFRDTMLVVLGSAGGGFATHREWSPGELSATAMRLVDTDFDGRLDLLVVSTSGQLRQLVNTGAVFVETPARNPPPSSSCTGLVVGDVNNDGFLDVYLTRGAGFDNFLLVGAAGGVFSEAPGWDRSVLASGESGGAVVVDIDRDGDLDVLTMGVTFGGSLFLNDPGPQFRLGSAFSLPPWDVMTLLDVDGDGDLDVVRPGQSEMSLSRGANSPSGTSGIVVRVLTAGGAPSAFGAVVRVEDASGGGWRLVHLVGGSDVYDTHVSFPDVDAAYNVSVAWPNGLYPPANSTTHPRLGGIVPWLLTSNTFSVLPVDVSFSTGYVLPYDNGKVAGDAPAGIVIRIPLSTSPPTPGLVFQAAAVSGVGGTVTDGGRGEYTVTMTTVPGMGAWPVDGLDVEVSAVDTTGRVFGFEGHVVPGMTLQTALFDDVGAQKTFCCGDVDGDGHLDVFTETRAFFGLPDGSWNRSDVSPFDSGTTACVASAFDGSTRSRVASAAGSVTAVRQYVGGEWSVLWSGSTLLSTPGGLLAGDVSGNGWPDIVIVAQQGLGLLLNQGAGGSFTNDMASSWRLTTAGAPTDGKLVDVDDDGDLDVVVTTEESGLVFVNSAAAGQEEFVEESGSRLPGLPPTHYTGVVVLDYNNDGVMDLFMAALSGAHVLLYGSPGESAFAADGVWPTVSTYRVGALDIEPDGDVDLFLPGGLPPYVGGVYANNGRGSWFHSGAQHSVIGTPYILTDLGFDGDLDALTAASVNENYASSVQPTSIRVRPLLGDGLMSAHGATVHVACVNPVCVGWQLASCLGCHSPLSMHGTYDVYVGVPHSAGRYNVSVVFPNGAGEASWATHPGLGGVDVLTAPVLQVLLEPASLAFEVTPVASQGLAALGSDAEVAFSATVAGLTVSSADVSGQAGSVVKVAASKTVTVGFVVADELWPWRGVDVHVSTTDSGGLSSALGGTLKPAAAFVAGTPGVLAAALGGVQATFLCGVDFDGDGLEDVGAVNKAHEVMVFVQTGDGLFEDKTGEYGAANEQASLALFVDVSGDGTVDLLTARGSLVSLSIGAPFGFVREDAWLPAAVLGSFSVTHILGADVDGNGFGDVLIFTNVDMFALESDGTALVDATAALQLSVPGVHTAHAQFADVTGDGLGDLWRCTAGGVSDLLHVNNGLAGAGLGFAEEGAGRGVQAGVGCASVVFVDVDNSGALDVVVSTEALRMVLYLNDGGGEFVVSAALDGIARDGLHGFAALDVNMDGVLDFVLETLDGVGAVVVNGGGGLGFERVEAYGVGAFGAFVVDVGSDGDGDVVASDGGVWRSGAAVPTGASSNNVLVVRAVLPSGAPAVGAVVAVECVSGCPLAGWRVVRGVGCESGVATQPSAFVRVGVPEWGAAYNVTVAWGAVTYPPATHATHPKLGSIAVASLPSLGRMVTVRPVPGVVAIRPSPWEAATLPVAGAGHTLHLRAPVASGELSFVSASVNGRGLTEAAFSFSPFSIKFETAEGEEAWPVEGLAVEVVVEDTAGLQHGLSTWYVAGMAFTRLPPPESVLCVSMCAVELGGGNVGVLCGVHSEAARLVVVNGTLVDQPWRGLSAFNVTACVSFDANGDGDQDVAVLQGDGSGRVMLGGGGVFTDGPVLPFSAPATFVTAAALGSQDTVDVIAVVNGKLEVAVWAGSAYVLASGVGSMVCNHVEVFDVDRVGGLDVLCCGPDGLSVVTLDGGLVSAAVPVDAGVLATCHGMVVADLNLDGELDVVATSTDPVVVTLYNVGGVLQVPPATSAVHVFGATAGSATLDLNMDGVTDSVLTAPLFMSSVRSPDGTFSESVDSRLGLVPTSDAAMASVDINGDGVVDIVTADAGVYLGGSKAAGGRNTVIVVPTSAAGGYTEFGAVVSLHCASDCGGVRPVVRRVVGVSGGRQGRSQYPVVFAVPMRSPAVYTMSVAFPDGSVHDASTQPEVLGVVAGGHVVRVRKLPYIEAVLVTPASGVVGVGEVVNVTLVAGRGALGMQPAAECCFVNGRNVADTFVEVGGGHYVLSYVGLGEDPDWAADALPLGDMRLELAATGAVSAPAPVFVTASPAGDMTVPVVEFTDTPGVVTAATASPVGVACINDAVCEFEVEVVTTLSTIAACGGGVVVEEGVSRFAVPPANKTGSATATLWAQGGSHCANVTVYVAATDGVGNTGQWFGVWWVVDTENPSAEFDEAPGQSSGDFVSSVASRDATFRLGCTEPDCTFVFQLNGGPPQAVGANSSSAVDDGAGVGVGVGAVFPSVRLNTSRAELEVVVRGEGDAAGYTLQVVVDGGEVEAVHSLSHRVVMEGLADGKHVVDAVVVSPEGNVGSTPLSFEFVVDTVAPEVAFWAAPRDGDAPPSLESPVVVTVSEAGCVMHWRVVGGEWASSTSGLLPVVGLGGGTRYTLEVFAVDAVGNIGAVVAHTWTTAGCPSAVDVPPVVVTSQPWVAAADWLIAFTHDAAPEWGAFEYTVDGGEWLAVGGGDAHVLVRGLPPGPHTVAIRAAVPAHCNEGVADGRPPPASVHRDVEEPFPGSVEVVSSPAVSTPAVFADFQFKVVRADVLVWYSLDGGDPKPCGRQLRVGPLVAGAHTLTVAGGPASGPTGALTTVEWSIAQATGSTVFLSGLGEEQYTLDVFASDPSGNTQLLPSSYTWLVDVTPPATQLAQSPEHTRFRTVSVEFGCGVGEVGPCTYCWSSATLGGGCTLEPTVLFNASTDGTHALEGWAVDAANQSDPSPVAASWTIDATPPVVTLNGTEPATVEFVGGVLRDVLTSRNVTLLMHADEAVVGFDVEVDGVPVGRQGGPHVGVTGLRPGVRRVLVRASDLAGNVGVLAHPLEVLVDVDAPVSVLELLSRTPSSTGNLTVNVTAVEGGVVESHTRVDSVVVSLAGGGGVLEEVVVGGDGGLVDFTGVPDGAYTVCSAGVDAVGNVEAAPSCAAVAVDMVPPESQLLTVLPLVWPEEELAFDAKCSEPCVLRALLAGGGVVAANWTEGSSVDRVQHSFVIPSVPDGMWLLRLSAVDDAGNVESEVSAPVKEVRVDTTPPVLGWDDPPLEFTPEAASVACFTAVDATTVDFTVTPDSVVVSAGAMENAKCVQVESAPASNTTVIITGLDEGGHRAESPLVWSIVRDVTPPSTSVLFPFPGPGSACNPVDGVVVCPSLSAAQVTVGCVVDTPPAAPCRVTYRVDTLSAVGEGCGSEPQRRLAADDIVIGDWQDAVGDVITLAAPSDGLFRGVVRGEDAAGNVEAGNSTFEWYVDTAAPPAVVVVTQPDAITTIATALFTLRLEGDTSPGVTALLYDLDGGGEAVVTAAADPVTGDVALNLPVTGTELDVGRHSIVLWAVDQAGNAGSVRTYSWFIASAAPDVVVLQEPARVSGTNTPGFQFSAVWPEGATRTGVEPEAAIVVDIGGEGDITACPNTNHTAGVCHWNATLLGVGTYTLTVRASLGATSGATESVTWQYLLCADDEFATLSDNDAIACEACPVGANCEGGLTAASDLVATEGHWAPPGGSASLRFYPCPVEDACLPGGAVFDAATNTTVVLASQCATGHTGTLCAVCADGFFEQFGRCTGCGSESGVAWVIMLAVVVAVVAIAVVFFKFREVIPVDQLKVVLSMTQIIASANTAYAIPWPPLFADFLNGMRVFLIEAVSLTRANCAQPMTFFGSLVVTLVGFKVVAVIVVFAPYVVGRLKALRAPNAPPRARRQSLMLPRAAAGGGGARARRRSSVMQSIVAGAHLVRLVDWAMVFKVLFLFLFVAYPGVSLKIMKTFKCVEVEGQHWLVADMRLRCYEGEWYGYALYAGIMGCLYTAGLPLAVLCILVKNRRKLGEGGVVARWGFLYETYGVGAYLWEVEELVRKLWLSALVVLMEEGSPLQVTVAVLISGWAHVLHAVYKPWRGVGEGGSYVYALQHGSLFVTSFVFLMGLLFKVEGVSQDGTAYNFLAWAMLLACVGFLLAAGLVLARAGVLQLHNARRKKALTGAAQPLKHEAAPSWGATGEVVATQRVVAQPRAVRASRMSSDEGGLAWVGNPLRGGAKDAEGKARVGRQ